MTLLDESLIPEPLAPPALDEVLPDGHESPPPSPGSPGFEEDRDVSTPPI